MWCASASLDWARIKMHLEFTKIPNAFKLATCTHLTPLKVLIRGYISPCLPLTFCDAKERNRISKNCSILKQSKRRNALSISRLNVFMSFTHTVRVRFVAFNVVVKVNNSSLHSEFSGQFCVSFFLHRNWLLRGNNIHRKSQPTLYIFRSFAEYNCWAKCVIFSWLPQIVILGMIVDIYR